MHTGKQNRQGKAWAGCLSSTPRSRVIAEEQRILVAHWLWENISVHGSCRAIGVGITWLMHCTVTRFKTEPDHLHSPFLGSPSDTIVQQLYVEADAVCSCMGKKANKP
jgi:hypothetical protein